MTLQASQEPAGSGETSSPSPSPEEQSRSEHKSRVEAALARAGIRKEEREVAESEVVEEAAPDPKGQGSSSKSEKKPSKADGTPASPASEASASPEEKPSPQPRYDSDSFRKWAKNNPEKAAELAAKHFKVELGANAEGWKKHFIALEKKSQKQQETWDERAKAQDERDVTFKTQSEELLGTVQPILDVMEAESKNDFPAIDAFIETTFKMNFDEYCKRRLRGLAGSTTAERVQKVQLSKKDQEIADLKAKLAEKEAGEKKPEPKADKPKVSDKWVSSELPEDHGVRDLANWEAKVTEAYQDSFDGEDYEMTIEEAADQVLAAFLAKGRREPEPVTNGKGKPKPVAKPKPKPRDEDEDETRVNRHSKEDNEEYIEDFQQRVARALEKRARGR